MIRDWYSYCAVRFPSLHDDVVSATPDKLESMLFKDSAYLLAGKNAEFTHALLQSA